MAVGFVHLRKGGLVKLSVVIPCYNEVKTLREIVSAVRNSGYKDLEIIVVDDCSTDGSRDLLKGELSDAVEKVLFHEKNQGKGSALRTGFQAATGELVIVQDADLEYDPREFWKLATPILEGRADVVYGSRFAGGESHRVLYYWHSLGNAFLTTLSNMFTNINLTDMETCYKMFRREIIQGLDLKENRFGFEPEVTAKLARKGVRIFEVGISYSGRTYEEGKKIGWADGVRAIYVIVKYNTWSKWNEIRQKPEAN